MESHLLFHFFLKLLRVALLKNVWSVMENIPCADKNVHYSVGLLNILEKFVKATCSILSFTLEWGTLINSCEGIIIQLLLKQ
jgi:hypothetical protein